MQLTVKGSHSWTARYALSLFIGLLPVVSGVAILHWQANRALNAHALETAGEALKQFDLMLDNAELSAYAIVPLAGRTCADIELALREQVTRRPFVRAANLALEQQPLLHIVVRPIPGSREPEQLCRRHTATDEWQYRNPHVVVAGLSPGSRPQGRIGEHRRSSSE